MKLQDNSTIPTIVIATTDGEFNDLELVKSSWNKLMEDFLHVVGGCIGMGNSISQIGVQSMNRGECLIAGSFDSTSRIASS